MANMVGFWHIVRLRTLHCRFMSKEKGLHIVTVTIRQPIIIFNLSKSIDTCQHKQTLQLAIILWPTLEFSRCARLGWYLASLHPAAVRTLAPNHMLG